MFLILITIFFSIALILGLLSGVIINHTMENRIKKILKKYNYTLISIKNTHKTFQYKRRQRLTWKDLTGREFSSAKITLFKEVCFNTTDNKEITTLVAMESFLQVYNKLFFEINLDVKSSGGYN
jgi:ABC-type transport system involved in multi-copper enzyme maturation permease subunit